MGEYGREQRNQLSRAVANNTLQKKRLANNKCNCDININMGKIAQFGNVMSVPLNTLAPRIKIGKTRIEITIGDKIGYLDYQIKEDKITLKTISTESLNSHYRNCGATLLLQLANKAIEIGARAIEATCVAMNAIGFYRHLGFHASKPFDLSGLERMERMSILESYRSVSKVEDLGYSELSAIWTIDPRILKINTQKRKIEYRW